MSVADQQEIVNKHNDLRRQVAKGLETQGKPGPQPSASNMRQMVWDDNLANAAQILTDRCVLAVDTSIPAGRLYLKFIVSDLKFSFAGSWSGYGQNLAAGAGFGSWSNAIQAWYNEVKDFDQSTVGNYQYSSPTSHYSQVVWANSYAIGCGYTVCSTGWSPIYACNYGPAGNYLSQTVYNSGSPASACPAGTVSNDGLCTASAVIIA